MITYYFKNPEEALKRAKAAGRQPGCRWGGITLPNGKKGWDIYRDGKVVERFVVMKRCMALPETWRLNKREEV